MTSPAYTNIALADLATLRHQPGTAVVDVRDEWEFDEFNMGGLNLPLPDLRTRKLELMPFDTVILVCTNGVRSRVAAKDLLRQPEFGHKTIFHLHGGLIEAED